MNIERATLYTWLLAAFMLGSAFSLVLMALKFSQPIRVQLVYVGEDESAPLIEDKLK